MRDLSRLPCRDGDEARREAREWVEGFDDFLSFAVLAIVHTVCRFIGFLREFGKLIYGMDLWDMDSLEEGTLRTSPKGNIVQVTTWIPSD